MEFIYIFLTIVNALLGAIAAFSLKKSIHKFEKITSLKLLILNFFKSGMILGVFLYFIAALGSIFLLKYLDVLVFFPLSSISYVFSLFIGNIFLKEKITRFKLAGIVLIILGAIILV